MSELKASHTLDPFDSTLTPPVCQICGHAEGNRSFLLKELNFGMEGEFRYFECAGCGCIQQQEPVEDPGRYYPKDVYFKTPNEPPRPSFAQFRLWLRGQRTNACLGHPTFLGSLLETLRPSPPGLSFPPWLKAARVRVQDRILDVGCGPGKLLLQLHELGFQHLDGMDPFLEQDLETPWGRIRKTWLTEMTGTYNLVMMHHSFEHMDNPRESFHDLARLLPAGGLALIRIPVAGKLAGRLYGQNWVQLDAPRHIYIHTEKSISLLAKEADFRLERVEYDSEDWQFWASEQYVRGIGFHAPESHLLKPSGSCFTPEEIETFKRRAIEANAAGDGDQAAFFLRRL